MQFQLTLSLDNADARYEDGTLSDASLAGYLEQVGRKCYAGQREGIVRDVNGNTIGHYEITGD